MEFQKTITKFLGMGLDFERAGKASEALACYDRVVQAIPASGDVWLHRGKVLIQLQRWQEAIASFEKAKHQLENRPLNDPGSSYRRLKLGLDVAEPSAQARVGESFGDNSRDTQKYVFERRYEILEILRGGMGIIYIVYDRDNRVDRAVKTYQDEFFARNPQAAERFKQEALVWINLDEHANVTRADYIEVIGGKPFLFLEHVRGGDLGAWVGTARLTWNLPKVLHLAVQFCHGMEHALSKGIKAHRDIKPTNCLITEDGTLKVTDFGLAKVFDDANMGGLGGGAVVAVNGGRQGFGLGLTSTGQGAGTPFYMAPEQFDDVKRVDIRADIYSFGVMLFEMVTGRRPFTGDTFDKLQHQHKTARLPELPDLVDLDTRLMDVIDCCLAKDPARRFPNFRVLREELAGVYKNRTGMDAPQPRAPKGSDSVRWVNKGKCLSAFGWHGEAVRCFEQALQINSHDAETWINAETWVNKGDSLLQLGRLQESLDCYEHAFRIKPGMSSLHWWDRKGLALAQFGRQREAIAFYDHVIQINPQRSDAWHGKGLALLKLNRPQEAVVCFEQALQIMLPPLSPETWMGKGLALMQLGRPEEALVCFGEALQINPRLAAAWNQIGRAMLGKNRPQEALACCEHALQISPHYAVAWSDKGNTLLRLSRPEEALACFEKTLQLDSRNATAWTNKGSTLGKLGRREEALACYDQAIQVNPRDADKWIKKGHFLVDLARFKEALVCFEQAQRLGNPHAPELILGCRLKLEGT